MKQAPAAVVLLSLGMAGAAWAQEIPDPLPNGIIESCPGIQRATPDLAACWVDPGDLLGGAGPEARALAVVHCLVSKIQEWQVKQQACLESQVERMHRVILWPDAARRPLAGASRVLVQIRTLRQQIESLACGWRFSARSAILRDLYLRPVKLCKPGLQAVWGDHRGLFDADLQEYLDWSSTVSHNLVQERTVGREAGDRRPSDPQGPEYTWQRIADGAARDLAAHVNTPGEAVRMGAQLSADTLRVENNTLQLRAQTSLVEQQRRDYRRLKRAWGQGFDLYLVSRASDGTWRPTSPAGEGR